MAKLLLANAGKLGQPTPERAKQMAANHEAVAKALEDAELRAAYEATGEGHDGADQG